MAVKIDFSNKKNSTTKMGDNSNIKETSHKTIDTNIYCSVSKELLEELHKIFLTSKLNCKICDRMIIKLSQHMKAKHAHPCESTRSPNLLKNVDRKCRRRVISTSSRISKSTQRPLPLPIKNLNISEIKKENDSFIIEEVGVYPTDGLDFDIPKNAPYLNRNIVSTRSLRTKKRVNYSDLLEDDDPPDPTTEVRRSFILPHRLSSEDFSTSDFDIKTEHTEPDEFILEEYGMYQGQISDGSDNLGKMNRGNTQDENNMNTNVSRFNHDKKVHLDNLHTRDPNSDFIVSESDTDNKYDLEKDGAEEPDMETDNDPDFGVEEEFTFTFEINKIKAKNKKPRALTRRKTEECHLCEKKYASLEYHMRNVHKVPNPNIKDKPLTTCNICKKKFPTRKKFSLHFKKFHPENKPYVCEFCQQEFSMYPNLIYHVRIHTGEKPFSCETCQKAFRTKSKLSMHMIVHRNGTDQFVHTCEKCGKSFKQRKHLMKHILIHSGEKPFTCEICPKSFRMKYELTSHLKIHTGERPTCEYCAKSFSSNPDLIVHIRTHTGEKPFACDICDKRFSGRCHLRRHKVFHKGERKFTCEQCNKPFITKNSLNIHKTIHNQELKKIICQLCSMRFQWQYKLNEHMKTHNKKGEKLPN